MEPLSGPTSDEERLRLLLGSLSRAQWTALRTYLGISQKSREEYIGSLLSTADVDAAANSVSKWTAHNHTPASPCKVRIQSAVSDVLAPWTLETLLQRDDVRTHALNFLDLTDGTALRTTGNVCKQMVAAHPWDDKTSRVLHLPQWNACFPNATSLSYNHELNEEIFDHTPCLRWLEASTCLRDSWLFRLGNLTELHLECCHEVTNAGLAHLQHLEVLCIAKCDNTTLAACSSMQELRELRCSDLRDEDAPLLPASLRKLMLWVCDELTDEGFTQLRARDTLTHLTMCWCDSLEGQSLLEMSGLQSVQAVCCFSLLARVLWLFIERENYVFDLCGDSSKQHDGVAWEKFNEDQGLELCNELFTRYADNPQIVDGVCGLLPSVPNLDDYCSLIPRIVQLLEVRLRSTNSPEPLYEFFRHVAGSEESVGWHSIASHFLNIMRACIADAYVCQRLLKRLCPTACSVWGNLIEVTQELCISARGERIRLTASSSGSETEELSGIPLLLSALQWHVDDPDVVASVCDAVARLCNETSQLQLEVAHCGSAALLLAALQAHMPCAATVKLMCICIATVAHEPIVRESLVRGDAIRHVVEGFETHAMVKDAAAAACMALDQLVTNPEEHAEVAAC